MPFAPIVPIIPIIIPGPTRTRYIPLECMKYVEHGSPSLRVILPGILIMVYAIVFSFGVISWDWEKPWDNRFKKIFITFGLGVMAGKFLFEKKSSR